MSTKEFRISKSCDSRVVGWDVGW